MPMNVNAVEMTTIAPHALADIARPRPFRVKEIEHPFK
jgi:hypothetical protein